MNVIIYKIVNINYLKKSFKNQSQDTEIIAGSDGQQVH